MQCGMYPAVSPGVNRRCLECVFRICIIVGRRQMTLGPLAAFLRVGPRQIKPRITALAVAAIVPLFLAGNFAFIASQEDSQTPNSAEATRLVREVMQNEVHAQTQDKSIWSYREVREKNGQKKLFEVCETKAGEISRLVAIDGQPLNQAQRHAEDVRIHNLLTDPGQMEREAQKQRNDAQQASRLMKMFPDAFHFQYDGKDGDLVRVNFEPNPDFHPSGRQAQVFHHMRGTLLIAAKQKRLAEINGELTSEVKFGGGVLGHLDKGGTFLVKQQEVGPRHWEMTVLNVEMNGKALFFKTIDVTQRVTYTDFHPLTAEITPEKAAQRLAQSTYNPAALQN
jgi:hypothetical protein